MFFTWQYMMLRHPGDSMATAIAMWMPPHIGVPMGKALAYRRHAPYDAVGASTADKIEGYWGGNSSRRAPKYNREMENVQSEMDKLRAMVRALEAQNGQQVA